MKRIRLGDALVDKGLITQEQLQEALTKGKLSGKRVGSILVEMSLVTEQEIVRVLAEQLNVPQIDLSHYLIEPSTVRLIPENVARRHQLIPINKVGNKLTVAMVDPLNIVAIDDVALMTGMIVKPVIVTGKDLKTALDEAYGDASKADSLMDEIGDIGQASEEDFTRGIIGRTR